MGTSNPEIPIGVDDPRQRYTTYCNNLYGNDTVIRCTVPLANPDPAQMASQISFGFGVPAATQQACLNVAENTPAIFGGWSPLPIPDTLGFIHDIVTDPSAPQFPIALVLCLAIASPSLSYADRKTFFSTASQWVLNAYPTQGQAVLNAISTYATNRWMQVT